MNADDETPDVPDTSAPKLLTETEQVMAAARRAQAGVSKGENGRKRKASVERYLYQFMHGHGQTATKAFKDGWDRIFGEKRDEPEDFDEASR